MKNILLSTIMLITVYGTAKAQTDFCKDITQSSTGSKFIYESPTPGDKKEEVGKLGFIKVIDNSGTRIYFKLGLAFSDADLSQKDVTIVFEDDDTLNFSNLDISTGPSVTLLTETQTLYYTLIPLTSDQLIKFKTKKLKYYRLLGKKRYPGLGNPKVKLMAYANCMDSFTEGPRLVSNASSTSSAATVSAPTVYCKDFKKSGSSLNIFYTAATPGSVTGVDQALTFELSKLINTRDNDITYALTLSNGFNDSGITTGNVTITFEDGDELSYQDKTLSKNEKIIDGKYVYTAVILLNDATLSKLKTKKVKSFTIANKISDGLPTDFGVKIMAYANCLETIDKNYSGSSTQSASSNPNEKKSIDGFWGIKFGATLDEVKAAMQAKGAKIYEGLSKPDMLVYKDVIFTGRTTRFISLSFANNKFYEAIVVYNAPDDSQLLGQFNLLTTELANVYGEANIVKEFQPPYTAGDGYEVQAIKLGKANYFATWKTNNNNTLLLQISKSGTISLFYTDKTLEKLKDAKKSSDY